MTWPFEPDRGSPLQAPLEAEYEPDDREPDPSPSEMRPRGAVSVLRMASVVLLAGSVALHVVAMFPNHYGDPSAGSLASQADQVALFSIVAAAWALALALSLLPGKVTVAAGLAGGLAAGELGYRLSDLGLFLRYGGRLAGPGLWLMTAAWGVGTVGAVASMGAVFLTRRQVNGSGTDAAGRAHDPPKGRFDRWVAVLGIGILSIAAAGFFLPPWDNVAGISRVLGRQVFSQNLGNAFHNPWQVILADLVTAAAIAVVPIVAAWHMWRDRSAGAAAVGGVLALLGAQFASAVVAVDHAPSPTSFGFSSGQVQNFGLVIVTKLTGWFVLDALVAFSVFAVAMFVATSTSFEEPRHEVYSWYWDPYRVGR